MLIVGLIVAPLTLLWAALYTEGGAQFVVRHLPHQLGPVDLKITGLTGTVAHGLHVERVEIDHELVHLTFTNIDGRVRLAPLLVQTIRVTYASVEGAEVQVKRRVHPPTPSPPSFLPRWLKISADEAHVKRAELSVYNGFKIAGHATSPPTHCCAIWISASSRRKACSKARTSFSWVTSWPPIRSAFG